MIIEPYILLRIVVAAIAGGLIGFERRVVRKPAGLRTLMLVGMGAALFVVVTVETIPDDAIRIISGIATGVGFLGAGAIFRSEDHIKGLTTAASIWATAAIGIAAGLGEYVLVAIVTILVVLVLQLNKIEFFREL